jgi:hypothetical protein
MRLEEFDEAWYLANYPDVASQVQAGRIRSGRQHYIRHGFYEGRRGSAEGNADGTSSGAVHRVNEMRPHSIEAVCATPRGDLYFNGWINDDIAALTSLVIEGGGLRAKFEGEQLLRARRPDVEKHLNLPYAGLDYGVWSFLVAAQARGWPQECTVTMRSAQTQLAKSPAIVQHVSDLEMRDIVLAYLANRPTIKNVELAAARDLGAGLGDQVIEFNNRILREHRRIEITRFNENRTPRTKSIVTCLYGSPELLAAGSTIFAKCPLRSSRVRLHQQ